MQTAQHRSALELIPADKILIDGNWWIVREHSYSLEDAAPVKMQLLSEDREFISAIATSPSMLFQCVRDCDC